MQALDKPALRVVRLGEMDYAEMLTRQARTHAQVAAGERPDTLYLLSHSKVITTGRNAGAAHLKVSAARLQALGVSYFETGRGGDITYHGPGQLIGYPIVYLRPHEQDLKAYVWALEEIVIRCAQDFGVRATRQEGLRGIWVGNDKLAAIGVRLSRWVSSHGFALNVSTDLADFDLIVPCGLHDKGVTSLGKLLGTPPPWSEVEDSIERHSLVVLRRTPVGRAALSQDATQATWQGRGGTQ